MFIRLLLTILLLSSTSLSAKKYKIKFSVLAPEGSTWVNMMREFNKEIKTETKGSVYFKIYPGGISGDEFDVIRKMKLGKIHSAGFTGVGLGQILPMIRILELPRLFKSYKEVDYVTEKLRTFFEKEFEKKGYVLLGWAEVGFVNIFSNTKIDSLKSMNGVKIWAWEGDPLVKEMFTKMKVVPNPLAITDVFTSLQTGLIDAVYTSPLGAIALQWFTKTKYMSTLKLADATGAVLMSKKRFNKLPKDKQVLLKSKYKAFSKRLLAATRKDNKTAYNTLQKNNITFIDMNKAEIKKIDKVSEEVWQSLAGDLYPKELLKNVLKYRAEFRAKK